jgi:Tfp pilus assembly protein PilF
MTAAPDDPRPPAAPAEPAAGEAAASGPPAPRGRDLAPLRAWDRAGLVALAGLVLAVPVYLVRSALTPPPPAGRAAARYVGSVKCRPCHLKAWEAWQDSHHAKAMAAATDKTVLGDFRDTVFEGDGIRARFFKKGRGFFVETQGPDGRPTEYEIRYTFGFFPLQQYLIPFPGGRFQCLSVAWDSRKGNWFFLYPGQRIPPGDWMHWTRQAANWNSMCAECHSTGLRKRYDPVSETYNTTWTDINVGCETCHGPGSHHVEWAAQPPMARPSADNFDLTVRTRGLTNRELVELCAFCHSRRASLGDYDPAAKLLDNEMPELLREGMYYPDGQILEEVYEYGSFTQSKMYHNNVRCSDCHDVHSIKRRKPGNDLCLQCHRADTYDTPAHHFHKKEVDGKPSPGSLCERCHMPGRYYMVNDWRLDHSLRVPRPDLSRELGTPNACNAAGCHADKPVEWAVQAFTKWYGLTQKPHYGPILAAGRARKPDAGPLLVTLARDRLRPVIVRATALDLLQGYPGAASETVLREALGDEEPLIRAVAADNLEGLPPDQALKNLFPLLNDPARAVRLEAARQLAAVPAAAWPAAKKAAFDKSLDELRRVYAYQADFPQGRYNMGNLYVDLGQAAPAEAEYLRAIEFDAKFFPARMNLALLYNATGHNDRAEAQYRAVLADYPDNGEAAYSLGLLLAEENRPAEAEAFLQRAAERLPNRPRVSYNLGLLLQSLGKPREAEAALLRALRLEPDNPDFLHAVSFHYIRNRQWAEAKRYAERLAALYPSNPVGPALLDQIRRQSAPDHR